MDNIRKRFLSDCSPGVVSARRIKHYNNPSLKYLSLYQGKNSLIMEKRLLVVTLIILSIGFNLRLFAQNHTSFETGFGPGEPTGTWYSWDNAFEIVFDTDAGEMTVEYEPHAWDRLVQWIAPFDLTAGPYYQITLKADEDRDVLIDFKDSDGAVVGKTIGITGDNEFRTYVLDLTNDIESFSTPETMNEIQFSFGTSDPVTVVFTEVKLGEAAQPANRPPAMDPVSNMILDAGYHEVILTGISDGDGISEPLTITVETDNPDLITNLELNYTSPETTGLLSFIIPADITGEAAITITLTDTGEIVNTAVYSFNVVVRDALEKGMTYSFEDNLIPDGLSSTAVFSLSAQDEALKVGVNRSGNRWIGLLWEFEEPFDLTDNPYLNIDIKTERDKVLQIFLVDHHGKGYETELIETQFVFHELVEGKNVFSQNRFLAGDRFITATYDFTGADPDIVDISAIAGIRLVSNGTALTYSGEYYIDEIRMGNHAEKAAYIAQVPDHGFYINTEGKRTVLVPDIKNTEALNLEGAENLIKNLNILPLTYNNFTENNRPVRYGYTKIEFELIEDATGTETVTLTASGEDGYAGNAINFDITIADNLPPAIDEVPDMVVKAEVPQNIKLSGISDGNRDKVQEVTVSAFADNPEIIDDISVTYNSPGRYADLGFTALIPGETTITVTATDSEGAETDISFEVAAFAELNSPPVIDQVENMAVINSTGEQVIVLTGIHDGDNGDQQLTIKAESSDTGIIPHPAVNYEQGDDTAELIIDPDPDATGIVTITITVKDDDGTDENDGDKQTITAFEIRSMTAPVTGFEFDLNDLATLDLFKPEGAGVSFFLDIVDTLGGKALRIKMKDKWTFGGIWTDLPEIMDLSEYPIISFDVLSVDNETYHWNYFYDAHGTDGSVNRNIENSGDHMYPAPANEWTTITCDYRYEGDMNNSQGDPIDAGMIRAVLFNLHDSPGSWPFTDYSGVVYYRNIRVGDKAEFAPLAIFATIDRIPEQSVYLNDGMQNLLLSGISNGDGSIEKVTISVNSTSPHVVPEPVISSIHGDGTALLSYYPEQTGTATIQLTVEAEGAEQANINFIIKVLDPTDETATVTIDRAEKNQVIHGFGAFENQRRWSDLYAKELGASAVRIGIISNQFEPVNDNNDPFVLNMEGFNYDAFDFDYFRELKEKGVETFILTSWSPPAWMKRNLSLDHREQAIMWERTDNILEPYYYEEFAEMMVAVVRAFKDEAGIDLKAIGLQNEPFFNEPYASAILSGEKFAELIEIVGNRFVEEGLEHVGFFMPEQVFGLGWGDYSNEGYLSSLQANPVADSYTGYFAVHGYDGTGITPGFPSYNNWSDLYELVQEGDNPKEMWMTETHIGYRNWNSAMQLAGALHGSLWAGNISLWTNWSFGDMQLTDNRPNSSFFTSMNYFKYIRPGAVRVGTDSDHPDLLATAFENQDGRFVIVIINKGNNPISLKLEGDDLPPAYRAFRTSRNENFVAVRMDFEPGEQFILPPNSVTTFITEEIFMSQVPDQLVDKNSGETAVSIVNIANEAGTTDGLFLEFEHTNHDLFSNISLSEIDTDGTATLSFTPAQDKLGFSAITLRLSDDHGNTRKVEFFITVVREPVTAEKLSEPFMKVYPNPASEYIVVELEHDRYDNLSVIDISGRKLITRPVNSTSTVISTSDLNKGIYFIQVNGKEGKIVKRIVIN